MSTLVSGLNLIYMSALGALNLDIPKYVEPYTFQDNSFFASLGFRSFVIALVVILIMIGLSYFIDSKYKWFEQFVDKHLVKAFCIVWFFGFCVYDVGQYTGNPWSLLGNIPMAIVHAFGIFIFDGDVSALHGPFHNNWVFMACFSSAHLLAALVSLLFVVKYFGFHIMSALRRMAVRTPKETTFVFWGMNDASYNLAKDIKKHLSESNDYRTIVIRTIDDNVDAIEARNGMSRIFSFLTIKKNDLNHLRELDCITSSVFSDVSTLDVSSDATSADILKKDLHLGSVCKIIRKRTTSTIHFFLLSDNEVANIQAVANLKKDTTLKEFLASDKSHKIVFHCHARYNSFNRVIEDEGLIDRVEVKIVDSSLIGVGMLRQKVDLQPVSYVKIEPDATVSSAFKSLVVGFGEVGKDVTRFLYEFGSFVKTGSTDDHVERSDFTCHVTDRQMSNLAGLFVSNAPSIKPAMSFKGNMDALPSHIVMHDMDCKSVEFYQQLEDWIRDDLNYIVICTGSDDLNVSLAVRIFKLAIRYRKNLENFRILARIHNDENGNFRTIVEHYNRLWAADEQSINKVKRTHQKTITVTDHIQTPISLFGSDQDVYTYNNVVADQLEKEAMDYKAKYDASINELKILSGNKEEEIQTWENERKDLMQLTEEYKGYAPTYSGMMRLRRIQSQNRSNCLHKATKRKLAEVALGMEDSTVLRHMVFRKENQTTYSWKGGLEPNPAVNRVLDVLAQTEHLRWNASHEILGYLDEGDENYKDEARFQHGCLKTWQELSELVQSYDCNVVDVSLGIIDSNREV